jgi:hypothetical protein
MVASAESAVRDRETVTCSSLGGKTRSLLSRNFNEFWCEAYNRREELGLTHFAMMHADVACRTPGWLDVLIDEMEALDVEVMAAVVAVKNGSWDTSTRVADRRTGKMGPPLTLQALRELETGRRSFTVEDLHPLEADQYALCVNTGLWVCKFPAWWTAKVHFSIRDWIEAGPDGMLHAETLPEDWNFSLQLARLGVGVGATRAVSVDHIGRGFFSNQ